MLWAILIGVALIAGVLSGVVGFGGAALLLPGLHELLGPRDAVVALSLAGIASNAARVWIHRRTIDRAAFGWYAAGALPMSVLGGVLFVVAPLAHLGWILGAALLVMVVGRRVLAERRRTLPARALLPVGLGTGLLSSLAGTAGPLAAPCFLAVGLARGAFIGTEAAAALCVHLVKLPVYGLGGALTGRALAAALVLTPPLIAGAWIGKVVLDRVRVPVFTLLVEAALCVAAVRLLLA